MRKDSTLTGEQRATAMVMFARGHGAHAVATTLNVSPDAIEKVYLRWCIRGSEALVSRSTQIRYPFEIKREVVQRALAGETYVCLAQEFGLSSPRTIATWVRAYERDGDAGLQPKRRGRPPGSTGELTEVEQLQQRITYLEAQVAYLGKLRALRKRQQP